MSDEMHQTNKNKQQIKKETPDIINQSPIQHQMSASTTHQGISESNPQFSQGQDSILTNASATSPSTPNYLNSPQSQLSPHSPVASCEAVTGKKWNCDYCTYENFPLSLKCTMCRAVKPLLNEDIFRLQEAEEGRATDTESIDCACPLPQLHDDDSFQRRPYSIQKDKEITVQSIEEQLAPLSISRSLPQDDQPQAEADSSFPNNTPTLSSSLAKAGKWACTTCTFENWPKSVKCAMCASARGQSPLHQPQTHSHQSQLSPHTTDRDREKEKDLQHLASYDSTKHIVSRSPFGINDLVSMNSPGHDVDSNNRRKRHRQTDWAWLQACLGVVDGDIVPVEQYLSSGGDPARQLTSSEVNLLNRSSAFDAGYTLIHLAIRFQREEILSSLLSGISGGGPGIKRAPSYVAPDLAGAIRRHVAASIRHKKGFPCRYMQDITTFCLPADVEELPQPIQEQLFEELLDRDAQQQLEGDHAVINWSLELTVRLGSRLYALWNRSAGDCLLDAVLQATWGVFDRDNTLRRALADTLHHAGRAFYGRWRSQELLQAASLGFAVDERQLESEWGRALHSAAQPGRSLNHLHVFALAHVARRPLVVYAVDVVNSFRGEALGYACFQGVYLPLLWEHTFCSKSPICLGYTRGHFSALVPIEPYSQASGNTAAYICRSGNTREEEEDVQDEIFLPLTDSEGKLLPVHFLTCDELGHEEEILQQWMLTCSTGAGAGGGLLVARQRIRQKPLLVAQMLEEWLNHYRRIAQQTTGPYPPRLPTQIHDFSSDGETDEE